MSRLTLRLPESLHRRLAAQAEREGISLNQYIVYSLTRESTLASIDGQRAEFDRLLSRYPPDEAESSLHQLLNERSSDS